MSSLQMNAEDRMQSASSPISLYHLHPTCVNVVLLATVFKPPLAIARAASYNGPVHLFVCLLVCLSVAKIQKRDFLKN